MWLKQNDTPICKGVLLQIGVYTIIHLNYTPIFVIFQGVELKILTSIYDFFVICKTSVYKGYKRDKIEMRGDRAEMSDFPLYLNTVSYTHLSSYRDVLSWSCSGCLLYDF